MPVAPGSPTSQKSLAKRMPFNNDRKRSTIKRQPRRSGRR